MDAGSDDEHEDIVTMLASDIMTDYHLVFKLDDARSLARVIAEYQFPPTLARSEELMRVLYDAALACEHDDNEDSEESDGVQRYSFDSDDDDFGEAEKELDIEMPSADQEIEIPSLFRVFSGGPRIVVKIRSEYRPLIHLYMCF